MIKAMNNSWHPDCFCCDICQAVLADVGFVKNAGRSVPLQPVTIIPPSSFSLSLPLGGMIMSMMLFCLVLMFFYILFFAPVMHTSLHRSYYTGQKALCYWIVQVEGSLKNMLSDHVFILFFLLCDFPLILSHQAPVSSMSQ